MKKKCMRCNLVFHLEDRQRCLYCDALLVSLDDQTADKGDGQQHFESIDPERIIKQVVKDRNLQGLGRVQYLVGSYFKTRTFQFTYSFCRNEFKMGRDYSRLLIQPLNMTSFLMIPWVIFDLIDSLQIRLTYSNYCPVCGWKFIKYTGMQVHDPKECRYNNEYREVIENIINGQITVREREFKQQAQARLDSGERSAYKDLCSRKSAWAAVLDVTIVWFSIMLIIYVIARIVFPQLFEMINQIDTAPIEVELR